MKTLKKLSLTKTFITNLGNDEMQNLRGGDISIASAKTNSCCNKSTSCDITKSCPTLSGGDCVSTSPPSITTVAATTTETEWF